MQPIGAAHVGRATHARRGDCRAANQHDGDMTEARNRRLPLEQALQRTRLAQLCGDIVHAAMEAYAAPLERA